MPLVTARVTKKQWKQSPAIAHASALPVASGLSSPPTHTLLILEGLFGCEPMPERKIYPADPEAGAATEMP